MAYANTRHNRVKYRDNRKYTRKYKRIQKGGDRFPYYATFIYRSTDTGDVIFFKSVNGVTGSMDDLKEKMITFFKDSIEDEVEIDEIILLDDFMYYAFMDGRWLENPVGNGDTILNLVRLRFANNSNSNSNSNNNSNNNSNANNIRSITIPSNAVNAITQIPIEKGTIMVNFHNEKEHGRYYTKSTYRQLQRPKRNPFTREIINPQNVSKYKADL